jgi:retinol dehydrogenase-12
MQDSSRCQGRRFLVTGATSGIGRATAEAFARLGGEVTILSSNRERCDRTAAEIRASVPGSSVDFAVADLSDHSEVRRVARRLAERLGHVDVLVNNAGVHAATSRRNAEGFDEMLAVNYLGPFLLTNLLADTLAAGDRPRVVVVASEAHRNAGRLDAENFEELGDYGRIGSFRAYGRTKLLDILFAAEAARRLAGQGITVNSVCPGLVATNLISEIPFLQRIAGAAQRTPVVRTAEQGARMSIRVATDPALESTTGGFFSSTPGAAMLPPVAARRDTLLQGRVWDRTAELVGLSA